MKKFWKDLSENKKDEIKGILWFVLTILIVISLFPHTSNKNLLGIFGINFSEFIVWLTGCGCIFIPFITGFFGWLRLMHRTIKNPYSKISGSFLMFLSVLVLFDLLIKYSFSGGIIGATFSLGLQKIIGRVGTYVIVLAGILLSLYLLEIEYILIDLFKGLSKFFAKTFHWIKLKFTGPELNIPEVKLMKEKTSKEKKQNEKYVSTRSMSSAEGRTSEKEEMKKNPPELEETPRKIIKDYKLPETSLLDKLDKDKLTFKEDTREVAKKIEETLKSFDIEVKVTGISPGPVITRYEIEPTAGTKINKIVSLADDIALNLKATSIRIVAPIPGKGAIGIEIPSRDWKMVPLRDLLESDNWKKVNNLLTIALGKSIDGIPIVENLSSMPHVLIAGATGSGKSVCISSIIISLLYRTTPNDLKLFLIDPKRVELSIFAGLPHLYAPIISDAKIASEALKRLIFEMDVRYKKLASCGMRDIKTFNAKINSSSEKIPYIVVIIDELADLMLVAARDVEESITRLAQLARGVGIHLVLATQRPSVDVITGVIKANLPARIAFQVSSKVDSRTILDMNGAEALLGRGDMLFFHPSASKPVRAQGSLVSTEEIERVVEFWKNQGIPEYEEVILEKMSKSANGIIEDEIEIELLKKALLLVKERKEASLGLLKGALKIGDGKAKNLISLMETKGLIGPAQGSKPREIYFDRIESHLNS